MFTNGSTAIECGGGEKAAVVVLARALSGVACDAVGFEIQSFSMAK